MLVRGTSLIEEINRTNTATPTLWFLGHCGFAIRYANLTFYVDPFLSSSSSGRPPPLAPDEVTNADLVLCTHEHRGHMDPATLGGILRGSPRAKVVLPKSAAAFANEQAGIPYDRMTTTDNGLRIEYFKDNLYGRVYSVPSAHPDLGWTSAGGYPYLGYLIRFGRWTIYHAGDCAWYPELANHLKPFNVNVALLPVGGRNFSISQAAQLASDIGAAWVVPMHYGTFEEDRESQFVAHMLGQRPEQAFKVFQVGEDWTVPEE